MSIAASAFKSSVKEMPVWFKISQVFGSFGRWQLRYSQWEEPREV